MFVLTAAMAMPARAAAPSPSQTVVVTTTAPAVQAAQTAPGQTGGAPGTAAHTRRPPPHHAAALHSAEPAAPSAAQIQALRAHRPIDKNRRAKLAAHLAQRKAARQAAPKTASGGTSG